MPRSIPLSIPGILLLFAASVTLGGDAVAPRLSVEPARVEFSGRGATRQVLVSATLADGTVRDLTGVATFHPADTAVVRVDPGGVFTIVGEGSTSVEVRTSLGLASISVDARESSRVRPVSYRLDVAPTLSKAGCNSGACHGNINGKGGFRLSLRGEDATFDFVALTRDSYSRRVESARPAVSLILLKPTGQVPHEGGKRFAIGSPEYGTLLRWISEGMKDDLATAPGLVRLRVSPASRLIPAPGQSQQLAVTAEFSDGTERDVTRQASFDVNDPTQAGVSAEGRVDVKGPVETTVAVRFLSGRAVSRLAFLHDRPSFTWQGPEPINILDRKVFDKLKSLKILPSEPSTDAVFLRRAFLDAIGLPPSPEETRAFLADADPAKRSKLVLRLIDRPEFADFWALKWADLLRNEEKTMGQKGVWIFQRWLRDRIDSDTPLDEFARKIVSAKGSTWVNPPAGFYRTNQDPQTAAETFGQVFLGVRLQCARCHNHPFDSWTQNDYYGLAAYFGNVDRKICDPSRRDVFDKHEVNGDVIIHLAGRPQMVQPRSGEMMRPKPPGGPRPELRDDPNALDDLADWLTRDNPQFARNMANRVWFHLLGRGIVEPVDDFRDSNPPSNPALLDALTAEFVKGGYRLKPLVALIMTSAVYGLGSEPNPTNADDEANFARGSVRLLPAEVLLDSLGQVLEHRRRMPGAPKTLRASQFPGVALEDPFLKVFGKPDRLLTCECERSSETTLAQAFQLVNGESVRSMLEAGDNRIGRLLSSRASDLAILEELSLAILGHPANATESAGLLIHVRKATDRRIGWEDVAWAMVNSKEFLLRH